MTHFGASEDVDGQLAELAEPSRRLGDPRSRAGSRDVCRPACGPRSLEHVDAETAAAYDQAAPPEQLYAGLERYWRKRAEAVSASAECASSSYPGLDVADG